MRASRVVEASAPLRGCDLGGWTDTWFAGYGTVLNLALSPGASVRITAWPGSGVTLDVQDYGDRYDLASRGRHPLLEAAVDAIGVPDGTAVEISVHCAAPPGCSTGTSAAVTVALLGALDALAGGHRTPHEIAVLAHRVETGLGLQSGVQDQLCSALGGINLLDVTYPDAVVTPVDLPGDLWDELDRRLQVVVLGRPHVSSEVHEQVIAALSDEGPEAWRLQALRDLALQGRAALLAGDLRGFGQVMSANTEAQAALHPDLVSDEARQAIELARSRGALGWKVNGAGGPGGSLTLLTDKPLDLPGLLPVALSREGLRTK